MILHLEINCKLFFKLFNLLLNFQKNFSVSRLLLESRVFQPLNHVIKNTLRESVCQQEISSFCKYFKLYF